jgi:hyperosmotically inducible protein
MNKKIITALIAGTALVTLAACSATRTQQAPGEQIDDAMLLTSVKSALASESISNAADVNVTVRRGEVNLSGFVDTAKDKSSAAELARNVEGVKSVKNDIAVHGESSTVGEVIDDSLLTAKVKTALIGSPDTKAHEIGVETKAGVVQLSGFVDNAAAVSAATAVAKSVTGVKDVKNELSVKSY